MLTSKFQSVNARRCFKFSIVLYSLFTVSSFAVISASPAFAQSTTPLDTIVVEGETVDAPVEGALQDAGVADQQDRTDTAVTVTKQDLIKKRSSVAYDALETQPGMNVVKRLGLTGAGLSRLTLRGNGGVGPAGIQVYVDGRPDATVSFAHPTPSALGVADIELIEVLLGPSPVLHGSGKTGVINMITADPEKGLHGFIEASYGGFDTVQTFFGSSYAGDAGYIRVGGSYRETDGPNPDSDATIENINFKAKLQFSDNFDITFSAARNEDDFNVFREFFVPGPFTDPRTERLALTQTVADLTLNAYFGNVKSSLKFFYDDLDPKSQVLDAPEERADVHEKGIRFKTEWAASKQTKVIAGIDYLEAEAKNSPVRTPPLPITTPIARVHEELDELAFYLYGEQDLTDEFKVIGGVRLIEHSAYGDEQAWEAGLIYSPQVKDAANLFYDTAFRVRATRGYQSPTLQQLYGVFRGGRTGPANPDLGPEIVHQYEAGFHKKFNKGHFDVVYYHQEGRDLISIPASPPPPPPDIENNVEYSNHGVEIKLHYSPTNNLETMVGVSLNDFEQETNRFLRVPETTFDFGLTYKHSLFKSHDLSVGLFGRYAQDTFDVAVGTTGPRIKLDDYFVADLKINFEANENTRLFFGVDNITDENYELVTGIPAGGVSAYGGVHLKW